MTNYGEKLLFGLEKRGKYMFLPISARGYIDCHMIILKVVISK